jgi:hypothetical protein
MRPILKGLFSADVADLDSWQPASLEAVHVAVELEIGVPDEPGADLFQVVIATREALCTRKHRGCCSPDSHHLIVRSYNWRQILQTIEELIAQCEGADWDDCAGQLARYFNWEFEDHR